MANLLKGQALGFEGIAPRFRIVADAIRIVAEALDLSAHIGKLFTQLGHKLDGAVAVACREARLLLAGLAPESIAEPARSRLTRS